jgi:flagellar basal body-associated protein FliL
MTDDDRRNPLQYFFVALIWVLIVVVAIAMILAVSGVVAGLW